MKLVRLGIIAALALFAVQCWGQAPADVKYSQPPNMNWSYDLSSEVKPIAGAPLALYESQMADDWLCDSTGLVCDLHWWGSYWAPPSPGYYTDYSDSLPNAMSGGISGFRIRFYTDVPAGPNNPFSHPGTMFRDIAVTGNANETPAFQITNPGGFLTHDVYKYDLYLSPNDQFEQVAGTIYWVSVQAILPQNPEKQWGWHETTEIRNDMSVIARGGSTNWYIPCGGHDLAFELTTIPEPASVLAMISGLGGILGLASRRRRNR